ncbi:REP-associated tyrosine transposase [Pseudomonas sp.]|uniref:REP-associated tyrosine transposase n=1 Tax=Pseudomonas sp. TaxID=306 RepID=UPI003D6DAC84
MPSGHLRIGRYSESGRIYLLTSNTWERNPVFSDFFLGRLLVQQFRVAEENGQVRSLAWVVMPDHFHWLVELQDVQLARLMAKVKAASAIAINHRRGQTGEFWQSGFHDHALRHEDDLLHAARYVVANPLRAGLVTRLVDYPLWDAIWL